MISKFLLITVIAAVLVTATAAIGLENHNADAAKDSKGCKPGSKADIKSHGKCVKGDKKPKPTPDSEPPVTNSTA